MSKSNCSRNGTGVKSQSPSNKHGKHFGRIARPDLKPREDDFPLSDKQLDELLGRAVKTAKPKADIPDDPPVDDDDPDLGKMDEEKGPSFDAPDDDFVDEEIEEETPSPVDPERQFVANLLKTPPDVATVNACRVIQDWMKDSNLGEIWGAIRYLVKNGEHVSAKQIIANTKSHMLAWGEEEIDELREEADGKPILDHAKAVRDQWIAQLLARKHSSAGSLRETLDQIELAAGSTTEAPKLQAYDAWSTVVGDLTYLIDGVLAEQQPCVWAAPQKGLKTSLLADLAIAFDQGTMWMDHFQVNGKRKVAYFVNEGAKTLKNRIDLLLDAKGIAKKDFGLQIVSHTPTLGDDASLAWLENEIKRTGAEVVILDCLYLMLTSKLSDDINVAAKIGAELIKLTRIGERCQCTIILAHHIPKTRHVIGVAPTLADLGHAGVGDWSRGHVLMSRKTAYGHNGVHNMMMVVGGAAHDQQLEVVVDEGLPGEPKWDITVLKQSESIQVAQENKAAKKAEDDAAAKLSKQQTKQAQILLALAAFPDGATTTTLKGVVGGDLGYLKYQLELLLADGQVDKCEVIAGNKQKHEGWKINDNPSVEEAPEIADDHEGFAE